jgi:hypothetical protein
LYSTGNEEEGKKMKEQEAFEIAGGKIKVKK